MVIPSHNNPKRKVNVLKLVILLASFILILQFHYWVVKKSQISTGPAQIQKKSPIFENIVARPLPNFSTTPSPNSYKKTENVTQVTGSKEVANQTSDSIPRIIHQMHANESALSAIQRKLANKCKELNPHWEYKFWNDTAVEDFIKTEFDWYYPTWSQLHPFIKKLDTSRYMLMHHFGGIYIDVDVECVRPFDSMVEPLPDGAAWTGDFPEPMFVMSAKGNEFWLHALDRIKRVWKKLDAWHATGPAGLNEALREWIQEVGSGALVPWITRDPDPKFQAYTKNKNNTIPWFEISNGNYNLDQDPKDFGIWTAPGRHRNPGAQALPYKGPVEAKKRVGFIANEILDPVSCSAAALRHCVNDFCRDTFPLNYVVHHCMNTWRGRIGDS